MKPENEYRKVYTSCEIESHFRVCAVSLGILSQALREKQSRVVCRATTRAGYEMPGKSIMRSKSKCNCCHCTSAPRNWLPKRRTLVREAIVMSLLPSTYRLRDEGSLERFRGQVNYSLRNRRVARLGGGLIKPRNCAIYTSLSQSRNRSRIFAIFSISNLNKY